MPVGVTGELCVAGENMGQGYINDAGRTAAAFVRNPFGKGPLYKTGDLACWREDGSIIFMGRNDYQIKLNGQRIEPGEIEAALIAVEDVENAAVIPREDTAGNRILCAFYTGQKKKPDELHGILSRTLPTYMVPQVYTHLDAMPRTTSGKTDRAALVYTEITRIEDGSTYAPPETDAEKAICAAFSAVLKQKEVGRNADFFRLGGTSLQLISLLSRSPLEKITPSDFFKDPTPAGLAKRLDEAENTVYTYLMPLYIPSDPKKAIVLFPFAGGDAAAFTALVGKAREMGSSVSLYCVNWPEEAAFEAIAEEIRKLANREIVIFYSHCAGAAVALRFLDLLNNGNRLIKGYIAGAAIPPRKALAGFNTWAHMSDKTIEKILVRAGLPISPDNADVLHEKLDGFRRHTQAFSAYFQHKETITNTTVTIILSKADPIIPNYTDAEARWQKAVTDVDRVILIDTPSHYFQNTDTKLLLSLFSNLPD